jgi:hypothetical protein
MEFAWNPSVSAIIMSQKATIYWDTTEVRGEAPGSGEAQASHERYTKDVCPARGPTL